MKACFWRSNQLFESYILGFINLALAQPVCDLERSYVKKQSIDSSFFVTFGLIHKRLVQQWKCVREGQNTFQKLHFTFYKLCSTANGLGFSLQLKYYSKYWIKIVFNILDQDCGYKIFSPLVKTLLKMQDQNYIQHTWSRLWV